MLTQEASQQLLASPQESWLWDPPRQGREGAASLGRGASMHGCLCVSNVVASGELGNLRLPQGGVLGAGAGCCSLGSLVSAGFFINLLCERTLSLCCEAGHLLLFPACLPRRRNATIFAVLLGVIV